MWQCGGNPLDSYCYFYPCYFQAYFLQFLPTRAIKLSMDWKALPEHHPWQKGFHLLHWLSLWIYVLLTKSIGACSSWIGQGGEGCSNSMYAFPTPESQSCPVFLFFIIISLPVKRISSPCSKHKMCWEIIWLDSLLGLIENIFLIFLVFLLKLIRCLSISISISLVLAENRFSLYGVLSLAEFVVYKYSDL